MKVVGQLVRAGTMMVSGEEIIGIVVAVPVETLRALPHLPMYRDVAVETITSDSTSTQNHDAKDRSQ